MRAETRLAVVLSGSLVLWVPALGGVLRGDLDAGVAAIRFGMGAGLVWATVAGLNQLISGYAVAPDDTAVDGSAASRRRSDEADPDADVEPDRQPAEAV